MSKALRAGAPESRAGCCAHCGDCGFVVHQDSPKEGSETMDVCKKMERRKRHIAVDTGANLLAIAVYSAGKYKIGS